MTFWDIVKHCPVVLYAIKVELKYFNSKAHIPARHSRGKKHEENGCYHKHRLPSNILL